MLETSYTVLRIPLILTNSGKTLNKQNYEDLSIQNGDVWVKPFSKLFGQIEKNKLQKFLQNRLYSLESTINEYWNSLDSPITLKYKNYRKK